MATRAVPELHAEERVHPSVDITRVLVPLGRALFAAVFVIAAAGHFTQGVIRYAASEGVPFATALVPASGVLALAGGLSVGIGYKTRVGALLLIVFLVPVTFWMHDFWNVADESVRLVQRVMFLKNASMLGGAFLLAYFGGGPFSVDSLLEDRGR